MPKASEKNPGYTSTLSTNTLSLDTLEAMSEDESKLSSMCKVLGNKGYGRKKVLNSPDLERGSDLKGGFHGGRNKI